MTHVLHVAVAWLVLAASVASAQVCQLRTDDGQFGSAVCVGTYDRGGEAVFLTAGHCVSATGTFVAPEGRWVRAEPLSWWSGGPGKDLAILRCAAYKPDRTYRIGTRSPAVGSEVSVCGFARAGQLDVVKTRVRRLGNGTIELDCPGIGGVSGGPILVGRTVVGVLTHNDDQLNCGLATNAETIERALRDWGVAPGAKQSSQWSIGVGIGGGQCPPWGCRPIYPVVPTQPYYVAPAVPVQPYVDARPQTPGYPGWDSRQDQPSAPAVPSADLDALRKRLDESDAAVAKAVDNLKATIGALSLRPGDPGERGPAGPPGPPGPAGRDADTAALSDLKSRLAALEAREIPVRIVDGDGKTVDERRYKLGEALEFRLVPRTK